MKKMSCQDVSEMNTLRMQNVYCFLVPQETG
ncbi:hypothetical protein SAMN05444672_11351 [Bacillus sp. OK838]|nr:hypothetical protein SAMN05444672_11351 [Bacillus sp. OK838]